jgi:L-2-amino-thiazoline-4-carboxylic acid hydrolase-like protein
MKKSSLIELSRRDLLTKVVPACALTCLTPSRIFGAESSLVGNPVQEAAHKFDKEFSFRHPVTLKQFSGRMNMEFIQLAKTLVRELGEERTLEILKAHTRNRMLALGRSGAERAGDNSFASYINIFRSPSLLETLSMEIVEDTDRVFEIKVTECLSHEIYKAADFDGKFGFASVCYGDYAWAEGYNPKIKLIRNKTLMEGHDGCNHRYVWTG